MRKIEMEVFEPCKFLELASQSNEVLMNYEQFNFIRLHTSVGQRIMESFGTWFVNGAKIEFVKQKDDEPRNLVFVLQEFPEPTDLPFVFHKQTIEHNPPHQNGNCMQTCIAGLLGKQISEVPHFGEGLTFDRQNPTLREQEGIEFMNRVHSYLKSIGYRFFEVFYNATWEELKTLLKMNSHVPLLVSGASERGTNHSVIMYDGEVFDPHPDNLGLTGPMDNGVFSVGALVKIPGYFAKQF